MEKELKNYIYANFKYLLTGSTVICPSIVPNDYDIVILCQKEQLDVLRNKFNLTTSLSYHKDGSEFESYRLGLVNIIAVFTEDSFTRWKLATYVATKLNLKVKDDRIKLFTVIKTVGITEN